MRVLSKNGIQANKTGQKSALENEHVGVISEDRARRLSDKTRPACLNSYFQPRTDYRAMTSMLYLFMSSSPMGPELAVPGRSVKGNFAAKQSFHAHSFELPTAVNNRTLPEALLWQ